MRKNRPVLIALLIPLLLDLLLFFTALPASSDQRSETRFQQARAEVLDGVCEGEERVEEEEELLAHGLFGASSIKILLPASYARYHLFSRHTAGSALSCGWKMPLRI